MAGVGELRNIFRTFLKLRRSCQFVEVNINSDQEGVCHAILRAKTTGLGFQSSSLSGWQAMLTTGAIPTHS